MTGFCRGGRKFIRMVLNHASEMRFLRSVIGQLRRVRCVLPSALRRIMVVQKSSRVNLPERFLRGVVGELLQLSVRFAATIIVPLARETFRLEVSSRYSRSSRLATVDLRAKISRLHVSDSRSSRIDRVWFRSVRTCWDRSCPWA